MSSALLLVLAGPAVGAAALLGIAERRERIWVSIGGLGLGIGGAIATLVRVADDGVFGSRGFEADAWRAGLALGVLVIAAMAVLRRDGDGDVRTDALFLAGAAAACASLLAAELFTFVFACVLTSAALAGLILTRAPEATPALWRFALSDAALAVGALLAVSSGMRVPADARGGAAIALAVAAAVRCGVLPGIAWTDVLARSDARVRALAFGALRAQGFLVAGWLVRSNSDASDALMIAGAIVAAYAARAASQHARAGAALAAHAGLVFAGLGLASTTGGQGAVLLAAGAAIAAMSVTLGRVSSFSLGAAPLGATLPGAALIAHAAFARALDDAGMLVVAVAGFAAVAYLAHAGVGGVWAARAATVPGASLLPLGIGAVLAVVPTLVMRAAAEPAAAAIGIARPLAPFEPPVGTDLGVVFALAAIGSLLAPAARARIAPAPADAGRAGAEDIDTPPRAAWLIEVVAVVASLALFGAGIRRGFL